MSDFRDRIHGKDKKIDPEVIKKAEYRMGVVKAKLVLQHPFYGVLLSITDFIHEGAIDTMATDGTKIYYNAEFTMSLSEDEVYGVLLHEISHCIYMHCTRKRRMNRDHKRWNYATDFAINLEIKDMGFKLPKDLLLDEKFRNMNAEMIYDELPNDPEKKYGNMSQFDMHIESNDESEWDDMEDKILTAYEMTRDAKGRGEVPAGIKRWIEKMKKSKVKWERVFHRFIGQALSRDDYSYTRVNKRYIGQDIFLPDLRSPTIGSVVIGVDTSGSIGQDQLKQFAAEIAKIGHLVNEIWVLTCDAEVHEVVKINKFDNFMKKLHFKGGGGTDMTQIFAKIKELKLMPELCVIITDGYTPFGNAIKQYPVLWCLTEDGVKVPWGQSVYIPKSGGN